MVQVDFLSVGKLEGTEEHLLVLREHEGMRLLPITIGRYEASAIHRARQGVPTARPSVHELLAMVIVRLGGALVRVVIHDLREDTFFAQLELMSPRGLLEVDCRASDAVALALQVPCPILVAEEVLERAGVVPRAPVARSGEGEGGPGTRGSGR